MPGNCVGLDFFVIIGGYGDRLRMWFCIEYDKNACTVKWITNFGMFIFCTEEVAAHFSSGQKLNNYRFLTWYEYCMIIRLVGNGLNALRSLFKKKTWFQNTSHFLCYHCQFILISSITAWNYGYAITMIFLKKEK